MAFNPHSTSTPSLMQNQPSASNCSNLVLFTYQITMKLNEEIIVLGSNMLSQFFAHITFIVLALHLKSLVASSLNLIVLQESNTLHIQPGNSKTNHYWLGFNLHSPSLSYPRCSVVTTLGNFGGNSITILPLKLRRRFINFSSNSAISK